jgi:alcohol dehydrogenase class IV
MRTTWTFASATQLLFGRGAVAELGDSLRRLGISRVFVVTDRKLIEAGVWESVHASLAAAAVQWHLFPEGQPEPSLDLADRCAAEARRLNPEGVVGLGGGSNMDIAKMAALLLRHPGSSSTYLGEGKVPGPIAPLVCLPTTAGTGSEVSHAAAFTDTERRVKTGMLSENLRPRLAIVDPDLTRSCPPRVTADSGIDALTHAIEAYTAIDNAHFPLPPGERSNYQGKNPMGDLFAGEAIRLSARYLRRAVADGSDMEAREGMALAATLGGLAFSNVGVALVHALEYAIGGAVPVSHGAGNGLLLPFVMRFNQLGREAQLSQIAEWFGEPPLPENAIRAVEKLKRDIGIPERLRELGIRYDQLRSLAENAWSIRRITRVNPRPATVEDLEQILQQAW